MCYDVGLNGVYEIHRNVYNLGTSKITTRMESSFLSLCSAQVDVQDNDTKEIYKNKIHYLISRLFTNLLQKWKVLLKTDAHDYEEMHRTQPTNQIYWFVMIFRVRIAFRKTVVGD